MMKINWYWMVCLMMLAPVTQAGGLYDEEAYVSLVSDHIAKHIGDSITVLIYETTAASATANTDTSRNTAVSGNVVDTGGPDSRKLGLGSDFSGSGGVNRKGKLLASITARVVDIDDSGELLVEGKQFIEMNEDKQTITLSGRLRQSDIGANNTVISTRLSDARISYLSEGTLADQQKPGWITRLFNWIF